MVASSDIDVKSRLQKVGITNLACALHAKDEVLQHIFLEIDCQGFGHGFKLDSNPFL